MVCTLKTFGNEGGNIGLKTRLAVFVGYNERTRTILEGLVSFLATTDVTLRSGQV